MSLFNKDDINQVFPEATPDALTDSSAARYENIANAYAENMDRIKRLDFTGGQRDELGNLMQGANYIEKVSEEFESRLIEGFDNTFDLIRLICEENDDAEEDLLPIYEDTYYDNWCSDLRDYKWKDLETYYNKCVESNLDIKPEIIVSPEGRSLEFWNNLMLSLKRWGAVNARETYRLLDSEVFNKLIHYSFFLEEKWDEIVQTNQPRWSISIFPGNMNPFSSNENVDHDISSNKTKFNGRDPSSIFPYYEDEKIDNYSLYPTIESHITQLALHLMNIKTDPESKASYVCGNNNIYKNNVINDASVFPTIKYSLNLKGLLLSSKNKKTIFNEINYRPVYTEYLESNK